jgi:hypothetical protein
MYSSFFQGVVQMLIHRACRARIGVAVMLAAIALTWPVVRAQAPYSPALYSGLTWRMLGPFRGGRVDASSTSAR